MGNDNDDILEFLENRIAEAERQLGRLKAALAAYRSHQESLPVASEPADAGVIPPIIDICRYLELEGRPTPQIDIIRFVGEMRQKRYPTLSNHYSNVWRALEYHVRHQQRISCVDEEGRPAELKPLPPRTKGRKLADSWEYYDQKNWFVLKPESDERHSARSRENSDLFR